MTNEVGGEKRELRCFCSRSPLLGVYGVDVDGLPYIHVKVYKQHRIFGEFIFKAGYVKLRCRECYRWYGVVIRVGVQPKLSELLRVAELENEVTNDGGFTVEFSDNVEPTQPNDSEGES